MLRNALISSAVALLWCLACTQSEADACGDDLVYSDGYCRAKTATAGTGSGNSAGMPSDTAGESGEGGTPAEPVNPNDNPNFGATCTEDADCTGGTDYCAISPVADPYCTASGCDADASICPDDWTCFDVSVFAAGEPWICSQP